MTPKPDEISPLLVEYNTLFKANDRLYRDLSNKFGLSESAFQILYTIQESAVPLTQKQLCDSVFASKQTINSALKTLERSGYITLTTGKDRRTKYLVLTDSGKELASRTVDLVIEQEQVAIASMGEETASQFLALFRDFTDRLKQQFQTIAPASRGGGPSKENLHEDPII